MSTKEKSIVTDNAASGLERPTTIALLTIFSLTTGWDFYLMSWGVRPFDLLSFGALCFLIPVVAVRMRSDLASRRDLLLILGVAALSLLYVFVGVFLDTGQENAKNGIGFVAGIPFLYAFRQLPLDVALARRWVSSLIVVHCLTLVLQEIYFYQTGSVLNAVAAFGMDTRALSVTFRPTGVYQEPANFALSMAMLLSTRLSLNPRFDLVIAAGFISVLATFSLWGIWSTPALLLAYLPRTKRSIWTMVAVAAVVGGVAFYREEVDPNIAQNVDTVSNRVDDVKSAADTSSQSRYWALFDLVAAPDRWEVGDLIGTGMGGQYYRYGANGYAPLLKAGGICGLMGFWALLSALGGRRRVQVLYLLIVFGSAAQLWTMFFWWSWLGLITRPDPVAAGGKQPATIDVRRAPAWSRGIARGGA